jgi:signal peptidase I
MVFVLETVTLTVLLTVGAQTFVAQPFQIEHTSMLDTLREGQMVLVDKLSPRFTGFSRGEIVVFRPTVGAGAEETPYIKRVIGLPGDRVELTGGVVQVNGVSLDESAYVYRGEPTQPTGGTTRWDVPTDTLFVLGDHRGDSTDSRSAMLGLVPYEQVIGRALVRYWPPDTATVLTAPEYPELSTTTAQATPGVHRHGGVRALRAQPAAKPAPEEETRRSRTRQASGPVTQASMSRR